MADKKTLQFTFEVPFDPEDAAARPDQLVDIFHRITRFNFPVNNFSVKEVEGWVHKETVAAEAEAKKLAKAAEAELAKVEGK